MIRDSFKVNILPSSALSSPACPFCVWLGQIGSSLSAWPSLNYSHYHSTKTKIQAYIVLRCSRFDKDEDGQLFMQAHPSMCIQQGLASRDLKAPDALGEASGCAAVGLGGLRILLL